MKLNYTMFMVTIIYCSIVTTNGYAEDSNCKFNARSENLNGTNICFHESLFIGKNIWALNGGSVTSSRVQKACSALKIEALKEAQTKADKICNGGRIFADINISNAATNTLLTDPPQCIDPSSSSLFRLLQLDARIFCRRGVSPSERDSKNYRYDCENFKPDFSEKLRGLTTFYDNGLSQSNFWSAALTYPRIGLTRPKDVQFSPSSCKGQILNDAKAIDLLYSKIDELIIERNQLENEVKDQISGQNRIKQLEVENALLRAGEVTNLEIFERVRALTVKKRTERLRSVNQEIISNQEEIKAKNPLAGNCKISYTLEGWPKEAAPQICSCTLSECSLEMNSRPLRPGQNESQETGVAR